MKILYIIPNLKVGGVQRVATLVSAEHARRGHEVHLLSLEPARVLEPDPAVTVHTLRKRTLFLRNPLWAVYWCLYKGLLRKLIPESEFIWAPPLYGRLYRRKLRELEADGKFDAVFMRSTRSLRHLHTVPHDGCVGSLHGTLTWVKEQQNPLARRYFAWLHRYVFGGKNMFFVSRELEEHFLEQAQRAGTRLTAHRVINNPCDLGRIAKLKEEPLDFSEPFIVSVGRLTNQKRYDNLLRAFARVATDCKLVLVGTGSKEKMLKTLTKDLGLESRVVFTGLDPNPYRWVARAQMFVLSSDFEGFPNVLVEAVACQTPIVATRVQGASDILSGDMARGLVDIGDIAGIATRISEYLTDPVHPDPAEAQRFSIAGCADRYLAAALNQDSP